MVMISKQRRLPGMSPKVGVSTPPFVPILQGADEPLVDPGEGIDPSAIDPGAPKVKRGLFDRIKEFAGSDMGRAALLRSAAATFDGGLGAGIMAGADYVDRQKAIGRDQENFLAQMALKQQGVEIDQQRADQQGERYQNQTLNEALGLGLDRDRLGETQRSNRAKETIDWAELREAQRKALAGEALTARQQALTQYMHSTPSASTKYASDSARIMGLIGAAGKNAPQTSTAVETGPDGKPKKTTTTTTAGGGYAPEVRTIPGYPGRWMVDPLTKQLVQVP